MRVELILNPVVEVDPRVVWPNEFRQAAAEIAKLAVQIRLLKESWISQSRFSPTRVRRPQKYRNFPLELLLCGKSCQSLWQGGKSVKVAPFAWHAVSSDRI
jgi:hypothetical protein